MSAETGKTLRLSRILRPESGHAALVALDHGLHLGAVDGLVRPVELMLQLAENGADGFLLSLGLLREYMHVTQVLGRRAPGVIARLDWSNMWRSPDELGFAEGRTRPIGTVEDALRSGADAVLIYYYMGLNDADVEAEQVMRVAQVARECERLGVPCFIEPMARGERVGAALYRPEYIRLHMRQAMELGADAIKTDYTGESSSFRSALAGITRPVFIAGGPKTPEPYAVLTMVKGAMNAGASGIFFGRNIFQAARPERMMLACARIIHYDVSVEEAVALVEDI